MSDMVTDTSDPDPVVDLNALRDDDLYPYGAGDPNAPSIEQSLLNRVLAIADPLERLRALIILGERWEEATEGPSELFRQAAGQLELHLRPADRGYLRYSVRGPETGE